MDFVSAIAKAISSVFGWMTSRNEVKNAADIKAAEIAKQEQAAQDKVNKDIEKRDIDELRKDLAE